MEQQTANLTEATVKKDRKLKIICKPTLDWRNSDPNHLDIRATMEFCQKDGIGDTDPPMPGVVDPSTGKIDISHMPKDDKYTDNIDITFKLDDSNMKNADGSKLTGKVRCARADEGDYTFDGHSGKLGFGWFCSKNDNPPPEYLRLPPITIEGMSFNRKNDDTLEIDDNTPDGSPEYGYCVAFVLEGYGNYYISIDPIITTKGRGDGNFLLKD